MTITTHWPEREKATGKFEGQAAGNDAEGRPETSVIYVSEFWKNKSLITAHAFVILVGHEWSVDCLIFFSHVQFARESFIVREIRF